MKARIALSLSVIALASSLVSCSVGSSPVESGSSPEATIVPTVEASPVPVATSEVNPSIPTGADDAPLDGSLSPEKFLSQKAVTESEIPDGPAKRNALYVSAKIGTYLASGGEPIKPNCVEAVAGDMAELEAPGQVGCFWEEDGSYTLFSDHPDDPNFFDTGTALKYNSVKGFIKVV